MTSILLSFALLGNAGSEPHVIHGFVHDPEGNPISDASVFLAYADCTPSRARSGQDGEFTIADLESPPLDSNRRSLFVHKPGWTPGGTYFIDIRMVTDRIDIQLEHATRTELRVLSPDGEPVSGAIVTPTFVNTGRTYFDIPKSLHKDFAVKTNGDAVCTLRMLATEGGARVAVEHDVYGMQDMYFPRADAVDVRLLPVGRIIGQITADDPKAVRDIEISASSQAITESPGGGRAAARVRSDDAGRFEIPALAAGKVRLVVIYNRDFPFVLTGPVSLTIEAGKTTEINVPLVRGKPLRGTVVDVETGFPIEGVQLSIYGDGFSDKCVTGETGVYETIVGSTKANIALDQVPLPYMYPRTSAFRAKQIDIEPEAETVEVPPFGLQKGIALRGVVRDEEDRPAANAWVGTSWPHREGRSSRTGHLWVRATADGQFVLQPLPQGVEFQIFADARIGATQEDTVAAPGDTNPIVLEIVSDAMVPVSGRVIDTHGQPVPDARVTIKGRGRTKRDGRHWHAPELGNKWGLITNEEGRFQIPRPVCRTWGLGIEVEADGMVSIPHEYIKLDADARPAVLPDIVMEHAPTIGGVVVDCQGKPLPHVNVYSHYHDGYNRITATTDARGRFRLQGTSPDSPFVFAHGPGLRFQGCYVTTVGRPITMTVTRSDEPPEATYRLPEYRLSDQRRKALLQKLLRPVFDGARRLEDIDRRTMVLWYLASYDPQSVLDELRDDDSRELRTRALMGLGRMEEALEVAALMEDPYDRKSEFVRAADRETDLIAKQRLLAEALVHSRQTQDPSRRVVGLFHVAERLYDIGKKDAARRLVDEAMVTAQKLPRTSWNDHVRGALAGVAAPFDVESALALLEGADGRLIEGFGAIANKLAAVDPQAAERALNMLPNESSYAKYAPEVCGRMAATDLPRARGIASRMAKRSVYPYVFGVMARALSDSDPETARGLLREAFVACGERGQSNFHRRSLFPYAIALVRIAENVDPDSLHEYLWRAISQYPGPYYEVDFEAEELEDKAKLAILLAMYDFHTELRRYAMEPVDEYLADLKPADYQWHDRFMLTAMTLADPDRAVEWHDAFLQKATSEDLPFYAYTHIADVITKPRHELWDKIQDDLRVGD